MPRSLPYADTQTGQEKYASKERIPEIPTTPVLPKTQIDNKTQKNPPATKHTTSLTASRTPVILWTLGNVIVIRNDNRMLHTLQRPKFVDVSELQRAYGELKNTGDDARFPTEQGNDRA